MNKDWELIVRKNLVEVLLFWDSLETNRCTKAIQVYLLPYKISTINTIKEQIQLKIYKGRQLCHLLKELIKNYIITKDKKI